MSCSFGLAPHLQPAGGHSSVQVSARQLTGSCFWMGSVPTPLLSLPHRPGSTTFFTHLGFFLSLEVSLLHFQSGHWSFPPILICIYSLPCSLPPFARRVFLQAALKKLA